MAGGRVDTMGDYLRKMLGLISESKIVADADLPFLLQLEQMVVGKLRGPTDQAQAAGVGQAPGAPDLSQGPPPGAGMPMGPPDGGGPQAIPIQSGGLQAGPQQPSSDELRRILSGNR